MSPQITARVNEDLNERIEAVADEIDGTKADAIRTLLDRGLKYEEIEQENDHLRDQLAATNRRIDDVGELVKHVSEERTVEQRRALREERRAQAGIFTRAKWALTGEPPIEAEAEDTQE